MIYVVGETVKAFLKVHIIKSTNIHKLEMYRNIRNGGPAGAKVPCL
jgi:hypothetical protein